MKSTMFVKVLVGLSLGLSMSGCVYLAVEREGELSPSTRDIWDARQKYWLPPTAGGWVCCIGAQIPYVGPFVFYPVGYSVHLVEGCVVAPAYDIVCMPYDLWKRHQSQSNSERTPRFCFLWICV